MKRIAVLTSGGDAPGMNAAVRAVTRGALARGWEVFGVRNGYAGLLGDVMEPLAARDVGGIVHTGGTKLGSANRRNLMAASPLHSLPGMACPVPPPVRRRLPY